MDLPKGFIALKSAHDSKYYIDANAISGVSSGSPSGVTRVYIHGDPAPFQVAESPSFVLKAISDAKSNASGELQNAMLRIGMLENINKSLSSALECNEKTIEDLKTKINNLTVSFSAIGDMVRLFARGEIDSESLARYIGIENPFKENRKTENE